MVQQLINIGTVADDGTGDTFRAAFDKVNDNETELFAALFDNVVVIKAESDFPTSVSVGGVDTHVLENFQYIIDGNVSIVDPLGYPGVGKTSSITSINRSVLTYTGGIALFRDTDAQGNIEISGLTEFRAPGAKMWDLTASTGSFSFQSSGEADKFTDCESLGVLNCNGTSGFNLDFGTLSNFNQGLVVNNPNFLEINTFFVFGNNAVGCIYFTVQGASTVGSVNFDTMTIGNGSNETLFDLNTNIQSGVDAINIRLNTQEGGINGTIFAASSLTEKDNKVLSLGNAIIGDTIPGGLLSLTDNTTDTVISAIDTPTLVTGTWVVQDESQFTGTTGGRLTYNDVRDTTVSIDVSISVEPASGNGKVIRAYVAKNGTEITASGKSTTADNGKAGNMSLFWRADTSTTDFYEVFVENKTDAIDITVIDCVQRIP